MGAYAAYMAAVAEQERLAAQQRQDTAAAKQVEEQRQAAEAERQRFELEAALAERQKELDAISQAAAQNCASAAGQIYTNSL